MPLRSSKMKRFIFGFQRCLWCPKCAPLSSNSFIVTSVLCQALSLYVDDGISFLCLSAKRFRSWLKLSGICHSARLSNPGFIRKAPDQNRTDTSSLEGYGSTIELQAHKNRIFLTNRGFFSNVKNNFLSPRANQH